MTEYFIQNFILYSCNIIIIVVELLTQNDQKIIERIRHLYSEKKSIIIIHNMFKLELKQHVLERAELEIEGAFFVNRMVIPESKQHVPYYIEKSKSSKKNIIHLILGKDNCESGNFFNDASMRQLTKIIDTDADISKFDLLAKLNRYWEEKNGIYFTTFREEKEVPPFELVYENEKNNAKTNDKNDKGKPFYKLKSNKELQLKVPEFNVLGALKDLDITYHLFVISNPRREKIYYFELPGCMEKPKITLNKNPKENEQILTLTIQSGLDSPEEYRCEEGGLSMGTFTKKIKINDDHGEYKRDHGFTKLEHGILKIKLVLDNGDEC